MASRDATVLLLIQICDEFQSHIRKAKEKYDAALENLNRLVKKKKEMESRELMQAYEKSDRSIEEVLEFLRGSTNGDEDESE